MADDRRMKAFMKTLERTGMFHRPRVQIRRVVRAASRRSGQVNVATPSGVELSRDKTVEWRHEHSPGRPHAAAQADGNCVMTLGTILLIILILALIGAIPSWPYSSGWGYGPSGIVGTILVVVLILVLLGKV
jgi:hypothetical protein